MNLCTWVYFFNEIIKSWHCLKTTFFYFCKIKTSLKSLLDCLLRSISACLVTLWSPWLNAPSQTQKEENEEKAREYNTCGLSLSFYLSLSHTHTHYHSLSFSCSFWLFFPFWSILRFISPYLQINYYCLKSCGFVHAPFLILCFDSFFPIFAF